MIAPYWIFALPSDMQSKVCFDFLDKRAGYLRGCGQFSPACDFCHYVIHNVIDFPSAKQRADLFQVVNVFPRKSIPFSVQAHPVVVYPLAARFVAVGQVIGRCQLPGFAFQ